MNTHQLLAHSTFDKSTGLLHVSLQVPPGHWLATLLTWLWVLLVLLLIMGLLERTTDIKTVIIHVYYMYMYIRLLATYQVGL